MTTTPASFDEAGGPSLHSALPTRLNFSTYFERSPGPRMAAACMRGKFHQNFRRVSPAAPICSNSSVILSKAVPSRSEGDDAPKDPLHLWSVAACKGILPVHRAP